MLKRISVGIILAAILFALLLWLRPISLYIIDAVILAVIAVAAFEIFRAFKTSGYRPVLSCILVYIIGIYPAVFFLNESGLLIVILASALVALFAFIFDHNISLNDLFVTYFILIYPCVLTSIFFFINAGTGSLLGIMLILFIATFSDMFALFTGVTFKGKKLCPSISPNKTISGAIGGLFGGMLGATVIFLLFDYFRLFDNFNNTMINALIDWNIGASVAVYLVLGLLGSVLAQLGDLAASWVKRQTGIKDFGTIFPGHGGLVDRLDSIMFVIPLIYLTFLIIGAI